MGAIFDLLIPVLIVVGIAWGAFRAIRDRGKSEPRRVNALYPRSFASGPSEVEVAAVPPERFTRVARQQQDRDADLPQRPVERSEQAKAVPSRKGPLRRVLRNPESIRTAFILKEVLDSPIGLRTNERPSDRR